MNNCEINIPKGTKMVRDVTRVGDTVKVWYTFGGFSTFSLSTTQHGFATITEIIINGTVYPPGTLIDDILIALSDFSVGGFSLAAGETISSGMCIIIGEDNKAYKYDIANIDHYGRFCGISKTSGVINDLIQIVLPENIIKEVGSGWITGKTYFIGINALPTETPPTANILKRIGVGIEQDSIYIHNYEERILL